jgi:hypothetical protein
MAAADFNGDGYQDPAVTNENDNTVSVLLGNRDGTFQAQKTYGVGTQVEFVATGDLNLDGKQDIVVPTMLTRMLAFSSGTARASSSRR